MVVNFDGVSIGGQYTRQELRKLWGYTADNVLDRGIITPHKTNIIILFITEKKGQFMTQYSDYFDGSLLKMEGENAHGSDSRLINSGKQGDEVHLFHRSAQRQPFTYYGRVVLKEHALNSGKPSRFVFETGREIAEASRDVIVEEVTHGSGELQFIPNAEGKRKLRHHYAYERSAKNRAEALRLHGRICGVCNFDFDKVYGSELAQGFIEIHHIVPLSVEERIVNPAVDLLPVCSNCHSMLHRSQDTSMTIEELKKRIAKRQPKSA